jgi:hypothetical protein
MTPSGIKPVTFWLVAQCLNHATACPAATGILPQNKQNCAAKTPQTRRVCHFVSYRCAARQISVPVDQILAAVWFIYEHDPFRAVRFAHKDNLGAALCPATARISICVFQRDTALAILQVAVSHSCILGVR